MLMGQTNMCRKSILLLCLMWCDLCCVAVGRRCLPYGVNFRGRDRSYSLSWKMSWATPWLTCKTPPRRETVWNKPCTGYHQSWIYTCIYSLWFRAHLCAYVWMFPTDLITRRSFFFLFFFFRRESEHDRIVESIYEEMENQLKEEKDKQQSQNQVDV